VRVLLLALAVFLTGCARPPVPGHAKLVMVLKQPREYDPGLVQGAVDKAYGSGRLNELSGDVTQIGLKDGWVLVLQHPDRPAWTVRVVTQPAKTEPDAVRAQLRKLTDQLQAEDVVRVADEEPVSEAQQHFPEFRERFAKRPKGESFFVEAPFRHENVEELMWIRVESLEQDTVRGTLEDQPLQIPDLQKGQALTVKVAEIEDWTITDAQGKPVAGNYTAKALK
jgi:uncharacterized protein YegJ (DUF2314 family)